MDATNFETTVYDIKKKAGRAVLDIVWRSALAGNRESVEIFKSLGIPLKAVNGGIRPFEEVYRGWLAWVFL